MVLGVPEGLVLLGGPWCQVGPRGRGCQESLVRPGALAHQLHPAAQAGPVCPAVLGGPSDPGTPAPQLVHLVLGGPGVPLLPSCLVGLEILGDPGVRALRGSQHHRAFQDDPLTPWVQALLGVPSCPGHPFLPRFLAPRPDRRSPGDPAHPRAPAVQGCPAPPSSHQGQASQETLSCQVDPPSQGRQVAPWVPHLPRAPAAQGVPAGLELQASPSYLLGRCPQGGRCLRGIPQAQGAQETQGILYLQLCPEALASPVHLGTLAIPGCPCLLGIRHLLTHLEPLVRPYHLSVRAPPRFPSAPSCL